uniref:Amidohydrolase family protein n=1 Tax=Streptomyces sp. NBC_00003 TaxID=2903608 RepID=A0AAU2VF26_9ACTN
MPVHQAHDIAGFLDLIRRRAATTPEGQWIRTTTNWQELNLAERRMPTAAERDRASDRHPILVKRGGHNDVVNTLALRLAGITEDTPTPPGGVIGRDEHGRLNGRLIDNAMGLVEHLVPAPDVATRIDGLRLASADYAATGIGTVRDCMVPLPDLAVLRAAREQGALSTRIRALVSTIGMTDPAQIEDVLDGMDDWRYRADPLLHDTAEVEDCFWGPERVDRLFPARAWLDQGALVTADSDFPVGAYGAMRSVWGMVTRQTVTGVRGPEHAITRAEAMVLHTVNAARLTGESALRGTLNPGRLADLTLWPTDPTACPTDQLRDLNPTHTLLGGQSVHTAQ